MKILAVLTGGSGGAIFWHFTGLEKITGCHAGDCAKQPEGEKTDAVSTNPADIVIDENNSGIKHGKKNNRRNTGRNERRP